MPVAGKLREHLHFIFEECSILVGFIALRLRLFQELEEAQLSCLKITTRDRRLQTYLLQADLDLARIDIA